MLTQGRLKSGYQLLMFGKMQHFKRKVNNHKAKLFCACLCMVGCSQYFLFARPSTQPSCKTHQQTLDDGVSVFALIVDHFNVVQVGVSPVHQPADQVQSNTMRKDNLTVHQLSAVLPIHVTAVHPWCRPIVCEEHFAVAEKDGIKDGKVKMKVMLQRRQFI